MKNPFFARREFMEIVFLTIMIYGGIAIFEVILEIIYSASQGAT